MPWRVAEETARAAFRSAIDRPTLKAEHAPDAVAEQDSEQKTAVIADMVAPSGAITNAAAPPAPANR